MTGIVGGLIAALAWGGATVSSAQASRDVGPFVAFACANVVAFLITLPIALATGMPDAPASAWGWTVVYGVALIGAFGFAFPALTIGRVGIVAPVIAVDGAIAALFAFLTGEPIVALAGVGLVAVVSASSCPFSSLRRWRASAPGATNWPWCWDWRRPSASRPRSSPRARPPVSSPPGS